MAKIMILAETGFGKSTSAAGNDELGITGLSPTDTYFITATSKPLPGRGSRKKWLTIPSFSLQTTGVDLKDYRRIATNDPALVAHAITLLGTVKAIHNIVLDDSNYLMQDMYMEKALSTGWDAPKKIGFEMNKVFKAIEKLPEDKNFILMAHYEEYNKVDGKLGVRMKTTGKMVQEYVTPEGKFDIVLFGRSVFDETEKKALKKFVTKDDGIYTGAKDQGIFTENYIPNDLKFVVEEVDKYYNGE